MSELDTGTAAPIIVRPPGRADPGYTDADYSITAGTARRLLTARPDNTRRAYARNWGQFEVWCASRGRAPLPATPQTLAEYVAQLIAIELAPASIDQAIGTIRSRHADTGFVGHPETRETLRMLRAYKRDWADGGGRVRKAAPVLIDALRSMVSTCNPEQPAGVRDRALLLLGFNAMCRRSELSGFDIADIQDAGDEGITAFIRRSKTDQAAEGIGVAVPFGQHAQTCAVRALKSWTAELATRGITTGALFRPIDKHGRFGGQAQQAGKHATRLTGTSVSQIIHRRAVLAGLPEAGKVSGHSLRAGAATSAYKAGVPVSEIALHGRWLPASPVVLAYIRAVDQWRHNPMKGIGL